jgi:hypothetical protein
MDVYSKIALHQFINPTFAICQLAFPAVEIEVLICWLNAAIIVQEEVENLSILFFIYLILLGYFA